MKKPTSTILAAAVTGLLMGGTTGCSKEPVDKPSNEKPAAGAEKHACHGLNSCKAKGGCGVEGKHSCRGKNECKNQGGCPTVPKHDCATKNECKNQGGCKSKGGCAGKNDCAKKGGCAVPVKKKAG